jgi:hypothetical protein
MRFRPELPPASKRLPAANRVCVRPSSSSTYAARPRSFNATRKPVFKGSTAAGPDETEDALKTAAGSAERAGAGLGVPGLWGPDGVPDGRKKMKRKKIAAATRTNGAADVFL